MLPIIFAVPILETIFTVVASTIAARAASDLYDKITEDEDKKD